MLDRVVVERQRFIRGRIVRVHSGLGTSVVLDEFLQGGGIGGRDNLRCDLLGGAIPGSHDGSLARRAASGQFLPLVFRHVLAIAAEIGLVHFSGKGCCGYRLDRPRTRR